MTESYPEAAALLRNAGWTPHPEWGVYTRGTLVMGGLGGSFHVKDYARVPPGHPQYSADTPDTAEEAATWLVERFAPAEPNPLSLHHPDMVADALAQEPEQGETPQHESDGETGTDTSDQEAGTAAEAGAGLGDDDFAQGSDTALAEADVRADGFSEQIELRDDITDADFEAIDQLGSEDDLLADDDFERPAIEGADAEDFAPEDLTHAEPPQDRFIGLDDLDRRRSLRIGDTMRHANSLMPPWSEGDLARLVTLRNFAMGVSEGRWDDDPAQSIELNALETTLRRINEIKEARDQKVAFLEATDRAGVEGFVVEADWP